MTHSRAVDDQSASADLQERRKSHRASLARSISCHALPSPSIQRCAYQAGASGGGGTGASSARLRSPSTRCDDDPGVELADARSEQHEPAWPPARAARSLAAEEAREIDDAEQVAADVGDAEEPRRVSGTCAIGGIGDDFAGVGQPDQPALAAAATAPAATIPPARPSWSRAGSRAPAGTCAGRCGRRGPWSGRGGRADQADRGDLREQLVAVDRLHDVVARALAHAPDLVGLLALRRAQDDRDRASFPGRG